jgi:hypothetical protein
MYNDKANIRVSGQFTGKEAAEKRMVFGLFIPVLPKD